MPVCRFLKHLLIYIPLQKHRTCTCRQSQSSYFPLTFSYTSLANITSLLRTILLGLRLEKTLRGHLRWRCPEHQLRMLSHSTVLEGPGPSSLCRRTSCFRARTAVFSSICSNWSRRGEKRTEKRFRKETERVNGSYSYLKGLLPESPPPHFPVLDTHIPLQGQVPGPPGRR